MKVSIILPIRNEQQFISNTLNSIIDQNFNGELEILIADGMSDDGTVEILKQFEKKNQNIKIIDNIDRIVPIGFNKALTVAKGNVIIRLDGHATIAQNFIANCISLLDEKSVHCVGGPTDHYSNTIIGDSISKAQSSIFGAGGASFRTGIRNGRFVNTLAFGAYKRDVFSNIGGYDEELVRNQDEELNYRLIQNGGKIWIDPSIKSTYYVRDSIIKLFKQYFYYGFFKIRVIQKVKALISWRHLVPASFVLAISISIYLSYFYKINSPGIFLLVLYFSASIISSINRSIIKNYKRFLLLPLIYFSMHVAYGVGFIIGVLYFINKWGKNPLADNHFDNQIFDQNSNV